jgi:hypothetical protein
MNLLGRFALRWQFAKKKEIIVKNIFTQEVLAQYTSPNDAEIVTLVEKVG